MNPQIAIVLTILVITVVLFISERMRMDLVALLVMTSLVLTGLLQPEEALSGFSNPAVVTVWAVFILSGGLSRTGVANVVGRHVLQLAGQGEGRLIAIIMLTAGGMSAFMNNVGVAALLLPVVMDIARRTGRPPSKLLMPLAFGCLLGGLTTLIGTPPNLLVSNALRDQGLPPFRLFDFTPVGISVMLAGVAYMVLLGRFLLPMRDIARDTSATARPDLTEFFGLRNRLFVLHVPEDSVLVGKRLKESRLGSALGVSVIGIIRNGHTRLAPGPDEVLQGGDRLLVEGHPERLQEFRGRQPLVLADSHLPIEMLVSSDVQLAEVTLPPHSTLLGQTLLQADFRQRYGLNVLAIWRNGHPLSRDIDTVPLRAGDRLLVQGPQEQIDALRDSPDFIVSQPKQTEIYHLAGQLFAVSIPPDSTLVDKTLAESHLSDAFGLAVLGLVRDGKLHLMPGAKDRLQAGDTLFVKGDPKNLYTALGLQELEIEEETVPDLSQVESDEVGLAEVILSPHTTLVGKTLRELHFREKYGLTVLAIWREGKVFDTDLRNMQLRFGDALLLYGPREKLRLLGSEPDFLVLTESAQEVPRIEKAPVAALIMAGVLLPVMLGKLPIAIAAIIGAALMVLAGCLSMDEAYRYIEWRAVFLIAGMLPLGLAMQQTGAARFLADGVISLIGDFGPLAIMAGMFLLTTLAAQMMPTAAVAVLMSPIALNTALDMGISPHALMMAIAMSSSASFLSPVAHPANVLIMGPGGYRFTDYIKVGTPLTLVVLAVTLLVLPIFWPL